MTDRTGDAPPTLAWSPTSWSPNQPAVPKITVYNLHQGLPGGVLPDGVGRVIGDFGQAAQEMAVILAEPINRALREFDGVDWDKLGLSLDATVYAPVLTGKVTIRSPIIVVDGDTAEPDKPTALSWWSDTWRARAVLLAALYFALTASAEFEFKSDLLSKLENHLVVALAIYGAVVAWSKRQGK